MTTGFDSNKAIFGIVFLNGLIKQNTTSKDLPHCGLVDMPLCNYF